MRAFRAINRLLPHGPLDALRQLSFFVLIELCYEAVRGIAEGRTAEAFDNANWVVSVERATHTFFEQDLQAALLSQAWLLDIADWLYLNSHFVVTTTFLVWLYLFRNQHFNFVRNMFIVAMGLALVGYALMPTAPPRLFPEWGFVDTITDLSQVNHDSGLVKMFVNPYAAIPSMHIGFSLIVGLSAMRVVKTAWIRHLWMLYPPLVFFVIIVTANHFWLDAAAGAVVALCAALAARRLAVWHPAAWAWQPAAETVSH